MTKFKRKKILRKQLFLVILLSFFIGTAFSMFANINFVNGLSNNKILYIYKSDIASANDFKNFLQNNSYEVSLVNISNLTKINLNVFNLVIIGGDTSITNNWGTANQSSYLNASGKPIIGIYTGGASFFENISLLIGKGNTWTTTGDSMNITNGNHQIFNKPRLIPKNNPLKLYKHGCSYRAVYLPNSSSGILLVGRQATNNDHYPIVIQNSTYALWGFSGNASQMTQNGTNLFLNLVYFFTAPPATTTPIPGFDILFSAIALLLTIPIFGRKIINKIHK